jgi:hypothetical protein
LSPLRRGSAIMRAEAEDLRIQYFNDANTGP